MMEKIIKKIHIGLRWPPFSSNTQQPTNSWCGIDEGEAGDEIRGGLEPTGGRRTIIWGNYLQDGKIKTKNASWT